MSHFSVKEALVLVCFFGIFALKSQADGELLPTNITISKHDKTPLAVNQKPWIELHGSVNGKPVYLMVEKTDDQHIAGYLFDASGNKHYVYGEWFNNQLQVYDQANKRLTVLLYE
ncbi:MAG: hypothetical protein ABL933_04990 [Methyloglobulus sp.]|nr:hypothetical protein [Methyloglobulus sp.]